MPGGNIRITLAQFNPVVGDLAGNVAQIDKVWTTHDTKSDLLIFPEMFICGYPPEDLVLKPFFISAIKDEVNKLIGQSAQHKTALLLSCPWAENDQIYNAVHLIHEGEIKATRYKHHLPTYGVFDEGRIFTPGPMAEPIDFMGHKLGVMICEDMWYPDVAAYLKAKGAEILITINASPFEMTKHNLRLERARARVHETELPLLYVNQVGGQDELVFDGGSFAMDEQAQIIAQAPCFEEATLDVQSGYISTSCAQDAGLIYEALKTGLRDYVRKNGFPGILLGLSGGVDSALSAVVAVDALGADSVRCIMMPSQYTAQESLDDAQALCDNLGVALEHIPIAGPVAVLEELLPKDALSVMFENLQSRARGQILMAISNAGGGMVLSTGNKSEMAVGYATLYGDMCGGFNVLKDVYKTQVYDLCRWRNAQGNQPVIPGNILTRPPTAELKDNQTDQDSLPPYEVLDDILEGLIEHDLALEDLVARGHSEEIVLKVWGLLDRAEYKRRQAPPGVKITSRAFGRDRRYPITNHFR